MNFAASLSEIRVKLMALGYARSKRIRIYGEELEIISDPFSDGDGVSVQARSGRASGERKIRIPLPVLQMVAQTKERSDADEKVA
jgi:hypothetical protein